MGCWYSKSERQEMVSRSKERKRYMKQLVKARQALSASHAMYIWSLRATGSALLNFSTKETTLHHHHHHLNNRPPFPHPPPLSPSSETTWTSTVASSALPPPPPPPLTPPPPSSTWDFWDPFVPPPPSSSEDEREDETAAATTSDATANNTTVGPGAATAPSSSAASGFSKEISSASGSELAMVVSRNTKDLMEIVKEVDEYFLKAADAGGHLARLLEISSSTNTISSQNNRGKLDDNYVCNLNPSSLWSWGSSRKPTDYRNLGMEMNEGNTYGENAVCSHSSTVERLYAWEKKLYQEVKNAESIRIEHEKKMGQVRKLEMKRAEYVKTEKTKKEVEKLEWQMMVSSRAIETTAAEIINLREIELYPQIIEIVKGLMCMWRSMYESHQVQTHIVQQLKYLNAVPSTEPTSEIHRQVTLQLELEIQQWHQSFCNLVKAQRDYIQSLTGWLRLSLFHYSKNSLGLSSHESGIYNICEEWNMSINRIPDRVASEGIKSFLTAVHDIVVQQREEHKQKKRCETVFKDFEKKASKLKAEEKKYGPFSMLETGNTEKRAKVETLKAKAEEEKIKHEKTVSVTRAMTLNNLQIGFLHAFQAMVGFSSVCMQAFESVYNQTKSVIQDHDVRRLIK